MRPLLIMVLACVIFFAAAKSVAQSPLLCRPHNDIVKFLDKNLGEKKVFVALNVKGHLVEIFANLDTGSWTAILTNPEGQPGQIENMKSCFLDGGYSFAAIAPKSGDAGL